jgi:hypothetical protein
LLKVADRGSLTVKGCREVEGACSMVAGRLNLIVNCRRHVVFSLHAAYSGEQTGRRFLLEFSIGRQKLHAQGTQTAGRQAGAACLPRV